MQHGKVYSHPDSLTHKDDVLSAITNYTENLRSSKGLSISPWLLSLCTMSACWLLYRCHYVQNCWYCVHQLANKTACLQVHAILLSLFFWVYIIMPAEAMGWSIRYSSQGQSFSPPPPFLTHAGHTLSIHPANILINGAHPWNSITIIILVMHWYYR